MTVLQFLSADRLGVFSQYFALTTISKIHHNYKTTTSFITQSLLMMFINFHVVL